MTNCTNGFIPTYKIVQKDGQMTVRTFALSPLLPAWQSPKVNTAASDDDLGGTHAAVELPPAVNMPQTSEAAPEPIETSLDSLCFQDFGRSISRSIETRSSNFHHAFTDCCKIALNLIIADPTCSQSWKLLFLLPRHVLQPNSCQADNNNSLSRAQRFELFLQRRWDELLSTTPVASSSGGDSQICNTNESPASFAAEDEGSISLSERLQSAIIRKVRHGEISRAASMLTSSGIAPLTDKTIEKLCAKYPKASSALDYISISSASLQVSPRSIKNALKSAPRGSSPGCDGWRFEHLRILLHDDAAIELLTRACNLFLDGSIPSDVATAFASARLIALRKNANDVRPIAVGSVFRRLVAKAACSALKSQMASFFNPFQFGVATAGGAEHLIHLLQLSFTQHPDWMILKTDARNAFNSISRSSFLKEVAESFPSLYKFVARCYFLPPALCFQQKMNIKRASNKVTLWGLFFSRSLCNLACERLQRSAPKVLSLATLMTQLLLAQRRTFCQRTKFCRIKWHQLVWRFVLTSAKF